MMDIIDFCCSHLCVEDPLGPTLVRTEDFIYRLIDAQVYAKYRSLDSHLDIGIDFHIELSCMDSMKKIKPRP